jgi:hypothetical protein
MPPTRPWADRVGQISEFGIRNSEFFRPPTRQPTRSLERLIVERCNVSPACAVQARRLHHQDDGDVGSAMVVRASEAPVKTGME